jgi:hypothetical protein
VFADVYQDTTRCEALAPTPSEMVDDVAGACAPAMVIEPMPNAADAATAARPAMASGRRRRGELWDLNVPVESFTDVPSLSSIRKLDRA